MNTSPYDINYKNLIGPKISQNQRYVSDDLYRK